ncbi:beta family protein [Saccharothrix sp. AJ9571]|nr:beta family protein [Saccharothrix sp. AJ9571]
MAAPGVFHSLVSLRAKQGESQALEAVQDAGQLARVQPIIELTTGSTLTNLGQAAQMLRKLHRLGRIGMLDTAGTEGSPGFGPGPTGAFNTLADQLSYPVDLFDSSYPVRFIPVAHADAPGEVLAAIGRLCGELEAGGALRVRPGATALARVLEQLAVAPAELDAVVDSRYLSGVSTRQVDAVSTVVAELGSVGRFRSITVLSGSIPKMLAQTASWQQTRFEEVLWRSVRDNSGKHVRFGDYGVVHPIPGPGYRSNHVSVKYTCTENWLYLRERINDDGEPDEAGRGHTVRQLCRHLVDSQDYAGADFSWGDREIFTAASGRGGGFGDSSVPVALGTSHHLAHLARRAA